MRVVALRTVVGALVLGLSLATESRGQGVPFSQRAGVTQTLAYTEFSIAYGRPVARGRVLFGDSGVVKWNQVWHPGADSATRITFDREIEIEGHPVKAGEYSIWLIPRQSSAWTFILSRAVHVNHTPYPGEAADVFRVDVAPERGAHMETMAIYFPAVLRDQAVLRIHWGETVLPVRIKAPYRPAGG